VREVALAVSDLTGFLEGASGLRRVLDRAALTVTAGRAFALLGESGSGKTFLLHALLGLHSGSPGVVAGQAQVLGVDLFGGLEPLVAWQPGPPLQIAKDEAGWNRAVEKRLRGLLGCSLTVVPQDPATTLSPFHTVGSLLARAVDLGAPGLTLAETRERAAEWLQRVHMYGVAEVSRRYPHELSGGMAQRVALALALAPEPRLLAADEPTTGLDATLRVRMIELLADAGERYGVTLFLITHDTEAARLLARDVAVLQGGRVVEQGPAEVVLNLGSEPKHPYTRYLLEAERCLLGEGEMPPGEGGAAGGGETGCAYRGRCPQAGAVCAVVPTLALAGPDHWVACTRQVHR